MKKFIKACMTIAFSFAFALMSTVSAYAVSSEDLNNLAGDVTNYTVVDESNQVGSFQVRLSDPADNINVYQIAIITYVPAEGSNPGAFTEPVWCDEVLDWLSTEGKGKDYEAYNTPGKLGEQSEFVRTNFYKDLFDPTKGINTEAFAAERKWNSEVDIEVLVKTLPISELSEAGEDEDSEDENEETEEGIDEQTDSVGYYTVTNVPLGIYAVVGYTGTKDYSPAVTGLLPERDPFDVWIIKNNIAISLKASDVFLKKYIYTNKDENGKKSETVHIGQEVGFEIDFQLPTYTTTGRDENPYIFQLYDEMAKCFDLKPSTIKIQTRPGSSSAWTDLDTAYYTYTQGTKEDNGASTMQINFQYDKFVEDGSYDDRPELRLTYQARVNRQIEVGSEGNSNVAILTYETNSTGTATSVITDEVRAYTYGLHIVKQDGDTAEPGIEPIYLDMTTFRIYKEAFFFVAPKPASGEPSDSDYELMSASLEADLEGLIIHSSDPVQTGTKLDAFKTARDDDKTGETYAYHSFKVSETTSFDNGLEIEEGAYVTRVYQVLVLEDNAGTYFNGTLTTTGTAAGDIINGLDEGNYYLSEIEHKLGYNSLAEDVIFSIYKINDQIVNSERHGSYAVFADERFDELSQTQQITDDDGYYDMTIYNFKGLTLPSTGGIGTLIFTVTGIMIMFLAMILIKRRGTYEIEE